MKNPFPGMNPYLEAHWADVHLQLVAGIRSRLDPLLPEELYAAGEEHIAIDSGGGGDRYRPAISVIEERARWGRPSFTPPAFSEGPAAGAGVEMAEPYVVFVEPITERWVEIREFSGRLVTVIEVLSPANKDARGVREYRQKQQNYLAGGVNLVELDLRRRGEHAVAAPAHRLPPDEAALYTICISRAGQPDRRLVYSLTLRHRLPDIPVPLRVTDDDVVLSLQPLMDQVCAARRYQRLNYRNDPSPALPHEQAQFLDQRLRAAGLR